MDVQVGPVADGLVKKGWTITHVRKLSQVGMHSITANTVIPHIIVQTAWCVG